MLRDSEKSFATVKDLSQQPAGKCVVFAQAAGYGLVTLRADGVVPTPQSVVVYRDVPGAYVGEKREPEIIAAFSPSTPWFSISGGCVEVCTVEEYLEHKRGQMPEVIARSKEYESLFKRLSGEQGQGFYNEPGYSE